MQHYQNPINTNGFDFLEFTTTNPDKVKDQFQSLGFQPIAIHKYFEVILYEQNDIRFMLNLTKNSMALNYAELHGSSISAMGFRVNDAKLAYQHALACGAIPYQPINETEIYNMPAIYGVGNSLIYFVDYKAGLANYANQFTYLYSNAPKSTSHLNCIDHITQNLYRNNMNEWADFYSRIFNFREVRYFDIEGKRTELKNKAMTSPCNKIRITLNEASDDQAQIEEFLHDFNGEGIEHIALCSDNIYESVEALQKQSISFLDTPDHYYELLEKRLPNHGESIAALKALGILIDGETNKEKKLLLQIFTKKILGPIFFEIIQRKGDKEFGEGNFSEVDQEVLLQ